MPFDMDRFIALVDDDDADEEDFELKTIYGYALASTTADTCGDALNAWIGQMNQLPDTFAMHHVLSACCHIGVFAILKKDPNVKEQTLIDCATRIRTAWNLACEIEPAYEQLEHAPPHVLLEGMLPAGHSAQAA